MAHTDRRKGDLRPIPDLFPVGTRVGMHDTDGHPVHGTVNSIDEGGWIYVYDWKRVDGAPKKASFPGWLRSTHVLKVTV